LEALAQQERSVGKTDERVGREIGRRTEKRGEEVQDARDRTVQ
jgi:hypothetical protein